MSGDFLTPRERETVERLDYDRLHHGRWGRDLPFVWMRRLFWWRQGREEAKKDRYCKRHGHNPGVIWLIEGLPYPPSKDHMGKWECSFAGGGVLEFRGFCTYCWSHYTLPWPVKNPDSELEAYVHQNYDKAVYLDLRRLSTTTIHEMVNAELERINGLKPPS